MNITRAIEILQMDIDDPGSVAIEIIHEAEKLSVEALKRLQGYRIGNLYPITEPLPSETKD